MGFHGSANTGLRYMGARREARDRGYSLLFSIGPKGFLPCTLPQTVTHSPGLFNAVGCQCRESEKTAITNMVSAGRLNRESELELEHRRGSSILQMVTILAAWRCREGVGSRRAAQDGK